MRNLKRALSLTLASVMLLGMMVVGSSAAAGYSDVDDKDNVEAIEVLQTVEVMVGDDRGFGPDRPVTRNEMAVVMGKLLNLDYNYYVSTCPFTDVADWAKGWVGACYANGIVSGRGNGIYDGEATVTAIEAASMMMRALGYFKNIEDYADGFQVVTVRQGSQIGIFKDVGTDANTAMTRNQVAQMALNALRSEMVTFTGTPGIEVNGVKVGYKAEYTSRTSTESKYQAIENRSSDVSDNSAHRGQYYVQLGEELYDGKLRLYNNAIDDFGRPARKWEYDGKAIGTYMKKELLDKEWTVEVTGKDFFDLLGSDTIKNYDIDITIDGVDIDGKTGTTDHNTELKKTGNGKADSYFDETFMTKTYKSGVGQTGKGVLTQVFVDPDEGQNGKVWVAVINTYLAKATADYSEKKDEAPFDVYALTSNSAGTNNEVFYKYVDACDHDKAPGAQVKNLKVSADDFAVAADVKKDDIVLVTVANGEIKTITEPQVLSAATLNGFSRNSYVVADSTQYDYNTTVDYDPDTLDDYTSISSTQHLKDTEYNVYLDQYGYLIGVEVVDAVKNYIFLTGIDNASSNLRNKTADAAGILLDGTFVEFTMNLTDSEAYWTHGGYAAKADDTARTGVSYAGGAADTTGKFTEGPLWNTWCTYTVDKNGVYTLKEVKDLANVTGGDKAKAGQYHDANYSDKDIDSKHISLKSTSGSNYVYGNDKSVYIVAELDSITSHATIDKKYTVKMPESDAPMKGAVTGNSTKVGIISDVESITTGIDNVSLNTWTAAEIEKELKDTAGTINMAYPGNVYTLFDNDGYVIAAVVVGEDDGTSKNLVYSHKDKIESEFYSAADDEWTWTRKVIYNGKETTLTEKGSDISVLKGLKENVWFEVTYKADGTVKDAEYVQFTDAQKRVGVSTVYGAGTNPLGGPAMVLADEGTSTPGDFVNDVGDLEYAINDNKNDGTTVYEQVWGKGVDSDDHTVNAGAPIYETNAPSLSEHTLYMNTAARKGFRVRDDVKTVFIQKNDGSKTTEYGDNASDLKSFLDKLNYSTANGSYCFKISAILDGAHASVVVIHDWNETGASTDGTHNSGSSSGVQWVNEESWSDINHPQWQGTAPNDDDIYEMLISKGYTNVSQNGDGTWNYTTPAGRRAVNQDINSNIAGGARYKVTANGHTGYFTGSTTWAAILGETYVAATHGDFAMNGTTPVPMNTNYNVGSDVDFDIGYYKVTMGAAPTAPSNGGGTITTTITAGEYLKSDADGEVTVKVNLASKPTAPGIKLSVTAPGSGKATITDGAVITEAGDNTVKVKIDKSVIAAGGVTLTFAAADAPMVVHAKISATKTVDVTLATGDDMGDLLANDQITDNSAVGVFYKVTNGATVKFIESKDTSTPLTSGDTVDMTKDYLKLATKNVTVDVSGITGNTTPGNKAKDDLTVIAKVLDTNVEADTATTGFWFESGKELTIEVSLASGHTVTDNLGAAVKATVTNNAGNTTTGTVTQGTPDSTTALYATTEDVHTAVTHNVTATVTKAGVTANTGLTLKVALADA